MKANFIIPSWKYWAEPTRAQPLTQMYLATILENEGHDVHMTDLRTGNKKIPEADAFFYTVASPDMDEISKIPEAVKKFYPKTKHIAGGPHVSIFPDECENVFDAVVVGKGEEAIKQIARDVETDTLKSRYEMPANGEYPFPRRHFLPKDKIVTNLFKTIDVPSTTVLFSHGCPMSCTFCANYNRGPIQRRSLESIGEEIDYLKREYNIEGLSLQDEICIPPRNDEAVEFLDLMRRKQLLWRGQTRAGVPKKILKKAADSGCFELSLGLESVDNKVLKLSKKGIKVRTAQRTLRDCRDIGLKTRLYLLNGLPGEPRNIADKTIDFLERTQPDVVLLSTLQPYPGSEIYEHPERFGMTITNKDFSTYNHLRCRFKDSDDSLEDAVPFEYEKGRGLSKEQIMANLERLQHYLIERGMNK